jgi:hypothetical protein
MYKMNGLECSGVIDELDAEILQFNPLGGKLEWQYLWRWTSGEAVSLSDHIGKKISLRSTGKLFCRESGKAVKKLFQGYSYPFFMKLPQCDMCMVRPEKCHFHLGTCRDPQWGEKNCFIPHYLYLSETSHIKVGITRKPHLPYRWIDQGAVQAVVLGTTSNRLEAGEVEVFLSQTLSDKTNWRKMLTQEKAQLDLGTVREEILKKIENEEVLKKKFMPMEIQGPVTLEYPVVSWPTKVKSLELTESGITSELQGIKGQYLFLADGVFNVRKYQGHEVELKILNP